MKKTLWSRFLIIYNEVKIFDFHLGMTLPQHNRKYKKVSTLAFKYKIR